MVQASSNRTATLSSSEWLQLSAAGGSGNGKVVVTATVLNPWPDGGHHRF